MKLSLIILLLLIFSKDSISQEFGFLPGYIITNSNDTIEGLVKYANMVPYRTLIDIKFKENEKAKTKVYPPGTIFGYMANDRIFHSLKSPDGSQFMELLVDGYIRLYRLTVTSFGVPQNGQSADALKDYLLRSGDENLFDCKNRKFKERLAEYLSDNRVISEKIIKGEYKKKDLIEIITEYNKSR
jgi:hypothetical protein